MRCTYYSDYYYYCVKNAFASELHCFVISYYTRFPCVPCVSFNGLFISVPIALSRTLSHSFAHSLVQLTIMCFSMLVMLHQPNFWNALEGKYRWNASALCCFMLKRLWAFNLLNRLLLIDTYRRINGTEQKFNSTELNTVCVNGASLRLLL